MLRLLLALSALAVAAAAQAPDPPPIRAEDHRVARIGYRLAANGAHFCPDPYPLTGLILHHLAEYEASDRATARTRFGLERGPGVLAVVENSPAAEAGLAPGDILLTADGRAFTSPASIANQADAKRRRIGIEDSERRLEAALGDGSAALTVLRGGADLRIALGSAPGCPARVRLARSGQMNAFANRGYAIVTTALLGFARSDDEVAIILGHEMAHVILGHPEKPGKRALVRANEEAADRLGLRLAWAAGYNLAAAIPFWRRYWARIGPRLFSAHPGHDARERIVAETISDLGAQRPELGEGALGER